jgi:hypothetical protein
MSSDVTGGQGPPRFDRHFFEGRETFTTIGSGALGGKASGLRAAREVLAGRPASLRFEDLEISVPTLTVIATDVFDLFLERNHLHDLVYSGADDRQIAAALQRAELPTEIVGDLWALVRQVHTPLAVRSSSLLEDALAHPFAGVYATKMIPNNPHDPETRFRRLLEAVKFVYASTFFRASRTYVQVTGRKPEEEKMAVIVQEVVGHRHGPRFYPDLAGVARSWNFYPTGHAKPADGVLDLALGLGKTIVDGGRSWTCSPAHPRSVPPFNSVDHMIEQTQNEFWAVNMGPPPAYDPTVETEYLVRAGLSEAEADGTLVHLASTYDVASDRVVMGVGARGPRIVDFAPLLRLAQWPVIEAVRGLLALFAERLGAPVEIEFALTFPDPSSMGVPASPAEPEGRPARLGFLQVRPMLVSSQTVEIGDDELAGPRAVVRSEHVMGNGIIEGLRDIVYVRPEVFEARHTPAIAEQVDRLNQALVEEGRPYVLVGFGRWGSSDPWLGIPVAWAQIAGARVIVEASLPAMNVDMSQGAHFFHNLLSFRVAYFSVPGLDASGIDWEWLRALPARRETDFVRQVETPAPLLVRVDGRRGRGVVLRGTGGDA